MRVRDLEHVERPRHGADQVHEQRGAGVGRAERQPEDRPQVVLELARLRALDRPVTGVVHARRDLVRQQLPADVEQLEREHADVLELVEDLRRIRLGDGLRRVRSGCTRRPQDPVLVHVLDEWVETRLAEVAADGDQRQLAVERDALLQDQGRIGIGPLLDEPLAAAVVAEPPRLQDRREGLHLVVEPDGRDAEPAEELFLGEPVLRHLERLRRRDRARPPCRLDGTFSNSYVTTLAPSARRSSSSGSSYSPTSSFPTSPAGASAAGSRNRKERPSGIPASASIRPS